MAKGATTANNFMVISRKDFNNRVIFNIEIIFQILRYVNSVKVKIDALNITIIDKDQMQ